MSGQAWILLGTGIVVILLGLLILLMPKIWTQRRGNGSPPFRNIAPQARPGESGRKRLIREMSVLTAEDIERELTTQRMPRDVQ